MISLYEFKMIQTIMNFRGFERIKGLKHRIKRD